MARRRTNAAIKAYYKRAALLTSPGIPSTLKLTMMGHGKRGGYLIRHERLRRKAGKQLWIAGGASKSYIKPLLD